VIWGSRAICFLTTKKVGEVAVGVPVAEKEVAGSEEGGGE